MKKRIECRVSGRVQMVMYRDFATRNAKKLSLVGEVWNNPDGTVSVVAEGEAAVLLSFVERLKDGSVLARVENVIVTYTETTNEFSDFKIVYAR